MKAKLFMLFLVVAFGSCKKSATDTAWAEKPQTIPQTQKKAYFASGCFWCVEEIYESLDGVAESISGYSGGSTENPSYEASNTGETGHAEAVEIHFNPEVISFDTLVWVYFASQNIEQVNGQGPDIGSQYRSILFYQNTEEHRIIKKHIDSLTQLGYKVAAEVKAFDKFWKAEDYHQNYVKNNPQNPYVQKVSIPRFKAFQQKYKLYKP
ncbi:MAG: peptide-methionine (S)-S-oxide reductase MsrA [Flavobacteriaceae bacterium]|nr:peptide-methionine (S)-S-oxide reductase MsrA [Flavobacteriaceae bacterium]